MSQGDVFKILRENRKWLSAEDIGKIKGCEPFCIRMSLKKLYMQKDIKKREIPLKTGGHKYEYKIK